MARATRLLAPLLVLALGCASWPGKTVPTTPAQPPRVLGRLYVPSVPAGGGDVTGNINVVHTNAQGDADTPFITLAPAIDGSTQQPKYTWLHQRALFGATYDHVVIQGWNHPTAPDYNAAFGSNWISLESNYDSTHGAGPIFNETHISMQKPGGSEIRTFSTYVNWTSGVVGTALANDTFDLTKRSDGTSKFSVNATGKTTFYDALQGSAGTLTVSGAFVVTSGAATLQDTNVGAGYTLTIGTGGALTVNGASNLLDTTIGNGYVLSTQYLAVRAGGYAQISNALNIDFATGIPAGGTQDVGLLFSTTAHFGHIFGSGAPTASMAIGSLYQESVTGVPYYNTNGTTGWATLQSDYTVGSITASTTHTQVGATALTGATNDVSVCANASDAVKLPAIATYGQGATVTICNDGAQALAVWPNTGEQCGAAAANAVCAATIAAAACSQYRAYTSTKWRPTAL